MKSSVLDFFAYMCGRAITILIRSVWTRIFSNTEKKSPFSKISGYVWTGLYQYADSFLDPTCVPLRISINILDLVPNRIMVDLGG